MRILTRSTLQMILVFAVATVLPRLGATRLKATEPRRASVGCPADGQAGPIATPQESARTDPTVEALPDTVAYYKGVRAPGAFAPRGWHCHVWYGSGGGTLLVTPDAQRPVNGTAWPAVSSEAVELTFHDPGTSGRYEVEEYSLFCFHTRQEFRQWTEATGFGFLNPYEDFKNDSIKIRSRTIGGPIDPNNVCRWIAPKRETEEERSAEKESVLRLYTTFNAAVAAAEIGKMRFHDLRHSYGSVLREQGVDYYDIKRWMGHSSIQVTLDIYGQPQNDRGQEAAAKADAFLLLSEKVAAD